MTMTEDSQRRSRLGRGLAALIGDAGSEFEVVERARGTRKLPVEAIRTNPRNPRRHFREDELAELAASIRQHGVLQPIVVRPLAGAPNVYELVAGERRWRAAQLAEVHDIPVVIHDVGDREALEIAIVENVQRADLDPLEEAGGYEQLIGEFDYTQADLAGVIGKSRSHVANTLRLLKLPAEVKGFIRDGRLTAGHARALVNAAEPFAIARRIVEEGLTVRSAEALAQASINRPASPKTERREKDADTRALEKRLMEALGVLVEVAHKPNGSGELRLRYRTSEQLDELVRRLEG